MHDLLLKSGADIREMNIVRRHLCRLKGGRFVAAAQPATVVTLSLDTALPGMPWPDMCLPDSATFAEAVAILRRFRIWEKTPAAVRAFLVQAQNLPDLKTVKSFAGMNACMVMVGEPAGMCRTAAEKAAECGYSPLILASRMHGEARETGICLAGIANEIMARDSPVAAPCALICSGESPVTIARKAGIGGPNQELVLSFAARANPEGNWACAAIDTDGTDGPTDVAGGIADSGISARAVRLGLSFPDVLSRHDAGSALAALGGCIRTGHTGTNLQHLRVILIDAPEKGREGA
jgi:glycerate-2-kinase